MNVRDRAFNIIKSLKKVWISEYCDVQVELEKALQELDQNYKEALYIIEDFTKIRPSESLDEFAGGSVRCLYCGSGAYDYNLHDKECPWRRAFLYMEGLK